ncbi:hypothetical protein INT43_003485 [Umbelopsis isabellina]|uniref:C3H1-type domain-containing protein n=1 Tax=Mortierella isabellina TaxID=91625 RepID=A0A8H7PQ93_MORIS|nr:hypothetical protein INT43_003485 [Umbelopsis isabellina]
MRSRYYCDYCDCTFPDNATNRKNHIDGAVHQQNRQRYYAQHRSLEEVIEESRTKPPCRQFMRDQSCAYGANCKYSHIMFDRYTGNPIVPDEIQSRQKSSQRVRYELPKNWNKKDLSPSLLPPPRKGYDWSNVGQWS